MNFTEKPAAGVAGGDRGGRYDDFSKESCIDCNKLFNKSLEELCEQWRKREVRAHKELPRELVEKLIGGVMASPLISEEDKR